MKRISGAGLDEFLSTGHTAIGCGRGFEISIAETDRRANRSYSSVRSLVDPPGVVQMAKTSCKRTSSRSQINKGTDKRPAAKKLPTLPEDDHRFAALCVEPEHVDEQLHWHRAVLKQDSETLMQLLKAVAKGMRWPGKGRIPVKDYLRNQLLTFRSSTKSSPNDATTAAWHPFILEYCRRLGVESDAIDRLFQRFIAGDVTDKWAVVEDSKRALAQLDHAIQIVQQQCMSRDPVIHAPTSRKPDSPSIEVMDVLKRLDNVKCGRILLAMLELKATPDGVRLSADRIASKAIDPLSGAEAIKDEMVTLKSMNLVETTRGRAGGSKLIDFGCEVARELKKRGNGSTN